MNRDQARNAAALGVLGAHKMAGSFRCDHDNVCISRRNNLSEVDIEAMGKCKLNTLAQTGFDLR